MMDLIGVKICRASLSLLSAMKETFETFKLRDYQRDQPQAQYTEGAIGCSEGFQAGEGRW